MEGLLVLICGFVPPMVIAVLAHIYLPRRSRLPRHQVVAALMLGFVSAVPAYYLQQWLHSTVNVDLEVWGAVFFVAFIVTALVEEVMKGVVLWSTHFMVDIDEPLDLLTVSVIMAMGFAGVENILYGMSLGWDVALFRTVTAVPAHACFAFLIAYFAAMKFPKRRSIIPYLQGLILAWFFHGMYDLFILQEVSGEIRLWALVILVVLLGISWKVYSNVRKNTPHALAQLEE